MRDHRGMSAMDEYLDGLPEREKDALERVRVLVVRIVSEAEEGRSYGMPAYRYRGRPLLGFRKAKEHLSVFPFSPRAIEAVQDRLGGFDVAKGTIRFTPDRQLPDDVLTDLVRARAREIDAA
jgi:uncharacterized protein YdhG (YjbR/CyaY superfamily)